MNANTPLLSLDQVARKKLVLVKQIHQKAFAQSQSIHNPIDRLLAIIGFDLAIETLFKVIIGTLKPKETAETTFQKLFEQVEGALKTNQLNLPERQGVLHLHQLRNDAQHKVRYPTEIEVSECRIYIRNFLREICVLIWNEQFEKISLVDAINDEETKKYLKEAQDHILLGDEREASIKALVAFEIIVGGFADSITENVSYHGEGIVVNRSFDRQVSDADLFRAFMRTRELVTFQVIGANLQEYLRFRRYTRFVHVSIAYDGGYTANFSGPSPTPEEAEYVIEFVTNIATLIESLDNGVKNPFDRFK